MTDPVLKQLEERRRKAQQRVLRGKAIVERGNAELAECDRFEQFYRTAITSAQPDGAAPFVQAPHRGDIDLAALVEASMTPDMKQMEQIARSRAQGTLKAAIVDILKLYPDGLYSGPLLAELRKNGYPDLLRTSMSPQLSRMKGHQVENIGGRWVLKKKDAAVAGAIGSIFD